MNEELPSSQTALRLLSEAGCSGRVIAHCKAVSALAVKFAEACEKKGLDVDVDLVAEPAGVRSLAQSGASERVFMPI